MLKPSEKIRRLRKARSITQAELAKLTGIPVVYLTPIESGAIPDMERRLLDALGYRPDMDEMLDELATSEPVTLTA